MVQFCTCISVIPCAYIYIYIYVCVCAKIYRIIHQQIYFTFGIGIEILWDIKNNNSHFWGRGGVLVLLQFLICLVQKFFHTVSVAFNSTLYIQNEYT